MDTGRLLGVVRATARPAGLGIAAMLGGGLLYVPDGVAQGTGPPAPAAYLIAGCGVVCLAVAFAVVASGPFADRGPVYGSVSRVWGSRFVGALAAWPALVGYVALVALLAEWLGRLAPLPRSTGAYVAGTLDAPTGLAAVLGVESVAPPVGDAVAVAACALALGVHLLGRRRAAGAAALLAWSVVAGLAALLIAAFVPGIGEFVPGNFDPLYPTEGLRSAPVASLVGGVGAALFAFLGVEAAAYGVGAPGRSERDASGTDSPTSDAGNTASHTGYEAYAPVVAAAVLAVLVSLAALVALGVVNWARLNLADVPAADAIAAYLPIDPIGTTVAVSLVAGVAALVALAVPAARTLAGVAELFPPLRRRTDDRPGLVFAVVYAVAAALAVGDLVAAALYVAVPGLALSYLAVAVAVAAMPSRRPDLWAACAVRPSGTLGRGTILGGVAVAASLLGVALASDPATTLSLTLHRVALAVFEFELVADPLGGHVLALLAVELVGAGLYVVLGDYRASTGADLPPLDAAAEEGE
ncbi:hypothetical protein [Halobaculum magnesiiphilum]|uniref:Amino acid transporter n=1 Tax=Halobaculum magnesiiphilum TaxID=1017351 RepID=A0A8T8WDZ7_9EURY|nr:hypothetical protein [Halobaculum magnesiiphilum]QZP37983.1 hypothetical protein K6T50_02095 [Halobaculum magnesiiphilum]